jgi:hypothetical protein
MIIDPPDDSLATLFCYKSAEVTAPTGRLAALAPGSWLITMTGLDCFAV